MGATAALCPAPPMDRFVSRVLSASPSSKGIGSRSAVRCLYPAPDSPMEDLLTWRLLGAAELDPEALVPRLVALGREVPPTRRAPWLGRLSRALRHPNARLRAAAVCALCDASGPPAMQAVVDALHDGDAEVRMAAARTLVARLVDEPWRMVHLVFHPDPEVRRHALDFEAASPAPSLRAQLLADPVHRDALVARGFAPGEQNLDLLVRLEARGDLDSELTRRWLAEVDPAHQMTWARRAPHRTGGERRRALERQTDGVGRDRLDPLFALFARAPEGDASADRFYERWQQYLDRVSGSLSHETMAALVVACEAHGYSSAALRLLIRYHPLALGWKELPRADRRAALLSALGGTIRHTVLDPVLAVMVKGALCHDDRGKLDLRAVGALMRFRASGERYGWVVDQLGETVVADAFLADPVRMAPFLSLDDRSSRGRKWMIGKIRQRNPAHEALIIAVGAIVGESVSVREAESWPTEDRRALVKQLFAVEAQPGFVLHEDKARELAHALVPRFAEHGALARWLAHPDWAESRLGPALLARLSQVTSAPTFAKVAAALPTRELRRLLARIDQESLITLAQEKLLAETLEDHVSPTVARWASDTLRVSPTPRKRVSDGGGPVRELPRGVAETIRTSTVLDGGVMAPTLRGRFTGLVAALRGRIAPRAPNAAVATALLGSFDALEEVADELEGWIDVDDPTFAAALEERVVTELGGRGKPPLAARLWLYRFERHGLAAAEVLAHAEGGLAGSLTHANTLGCVELRVRAWATVARAMGVWWQREPERLARLELEPVLEAALDALDTDAGVYAALLYRTIAQTRLVATKVRELAPALGKKIVEASDEVRAELRELVDREGLAPRAVGARAGHGAISAELLEAIQESSDPDVLVGLCRDRRRRVVHEAVLRLVMLSRAGRRQLAALLAEEPPPVHVDAITASLPLWDNDDALGRVRGWLTAGSGSRELRFRVALGLLERGEAHAEGIALDEACAAVATPFLTQEDVGRLLAHVHDLDAACRRLARSPHPAAYSMALDSLLGRDDSRDADLDAVRAFLEQGTTRRLALRARAALWLERRGDETGLPLLLGLAHEAYPPVPRNGRLRLLDEVVAHELVLGSLAAGDEAADQGLVVWLEELARGPREEALERMLTEASHVGTRSAAVRALPRRPRRARKLRRLAEIFAWGLTISRELSGRGLRPHMISGDELGFTRLNENRIFVTPLPLLRGERSGEEIVEGLVLHEIGHHRHHRGEEEARIWSEADQAGLGSLLNLVADEHLERNLRAYDKSYGDRLKRLAAYAFQHAPRQIPVERLLEALGANAFSVLCACRLQAAARPGAVRVQTGAVLQELEKRGSSFARFMRALRMGLGDRHGDPKVQAGLALFKKRFRKSSMSHLWQITRELHRIFGDHVVVAQAFGGSEAIEGDPHEATTHGEGIGDQELQGEVERVLGPPDASRGPRREGGGRPTINVGSDESFTIIENVVKVAPDPVSHRAVAREVDRHARRLRAHLAQLGLSHVPRRMRLTGRRLDVTRIRPLVTRSDPRILVARETRRVNDLFLALVIDCSGSMQGASMKRAHAFGVLLTEAARGLSNVDLRVFGFDDRQIFDAGSARRPAVTSLRPGAGNNDAAGLWHAAQVAMRSPRSAKVLVMISDGLPTQCSVAALRGLVRRLTTRHGMVCAQVAVRPLAEVCFPHYVEVDDGNLDQAVGRFGRIVGNLVGRTLRR